MEFGEKLQTLRKRRGLTQEELSEALFVSRTAVSKWESGRGYPNIQSLKEIARFFSVTVDELLSSEEVLFLAEEDSRQKESRIRELVFSLFDISVLMFLFLPLFGQQSQEIIEEVSLISLVEISLWLRVLYFAFVIITALWGVFTLSMQSINISLLLRVRCKVSLLLSIIGTLLFILSSQPYAAAFIFIFLMIKVLMCIKKP